MGRSPRIEFPGALYHITNRGNDKRKIFYSNADRKKFLAILAKYHERYGIQIHCYALMDNHCHFAVETPQGNLSQVMHGINSGYTNYFNHKYKKVGHLFQGRFNSILIDKTGYLLAVSRYVHLNPVKAGIVKNPAMFAWSSYSGFIDGSKGKPWVNYSDTLSHFSDNPSIARRKYQFFVEGEPVEKIANPLEDAYKNIILGDKEYISQVENLLEQKNPSQGFPLLDLENEKPDPYFIINLITQIMGIPKDSIFLKKQKNNLGRKAALYAVHMYCGLSNVNIANFFGGIHCSAVSKTVTRLEKEVEENSELKSLLIKVMSHVKA